MLISNMVDNNIQRPLKMADYGVLLPEEKKRGGGRGEDESVINFT
jgi:hypothetical protein